MQNHRPPERPRPRKQPRQPARARGLRSNHLHRCAQRRTRAGPDLKAEQQGDQAPRALADQAPRALAWQVPPGAATAARRTTGLLSTSDQGWPSLRLRLPRHSWMPTRVQRPRPSALPLLSALGFAATRLESHLQAWPASSTPCSPPPRLRERGRSSSKTHQGAASAGRSSWLA